MKTVNILVSENLVISSLFGTVDFLQFCNTFNRYLHPDAPEKLFDWRIYSSKGGAITDRNGFSVNTLPISDYVEGDAVSLISAFAHDKETLKGFLQSSLAFKEVLLKEKARGTIIATYCTGTFGLASSGILDGGKATTVWWMQNLFSDYFPGIQLTMNELVVRHENIITGGATTSYFNVCMAMIEALTNSIFAMQMSKLLLLDKHRLSQKPFMESAFIISKHDELVDKVQSWMMKNFASNISLDYICELFAVSKRTLIRKFKAACGETPLNYLQKIRVEKAKHFLETTNMPVEQIVFRVGYEDTASFRKLFTSQTQLSPKNYRERFSFYPQEVVNM